MWNQLQAVTIVSEPWLRKMNSGRRLTKNAHFTPVITWEIAQVGLRGEGRNVVKIG